MCCRPASSELSSFCSGRLISTSLRLGSLKFFTLASLMPAASTAWRMAPISGRFANCTCTSVPPRKSTPSGTGLPVLAQCVPIETMPAALKINEKPRKYHFFPSQSTLTLRNNSTGSLPSCCIGAPTGSGIQCSSCVRNSDAELNRNHLARLQFVEVRVEDDPRDKNRREQVREQAK